MAREENSRAVAVTGNLKRVDAHLGQLGRRRYGGELKKSSQRQAKRVGVKSGWSETFVRTGGGGSTWSGSEEEIDDISISRLKHVQQRRTECGWRTDAAKNSEARTGPENRMREGKSAIGTLDKGAIKSYR